MGHSAGWHQGSKVADYIRADGNIEELYFPVYSPEENPQGHVWKNDRAQVTHNKFIQDIDLATDEFIEYLKTTKFKFEASALVQSNNAISIG